jgi:hypothetical protein
MPKSDPKNPVTAPLLEYFHLPPPNCPAFNKIIQKTQPN